MAEPIIPWTPQVSVPPQVRPPQSANIVTPRSRISFKTIAIGCGIVFLIVVGGLSAIFFNLMKNPTQLSTVGLDPATTKTLLQTFSILFFGVLTFLGIGFLVVNLYRIITSKNVSKIRYAFGAFIGFLIFLFAIVIGTRIITLVNNFSVENILDSDKLIMPFLQIKDETIYTRKDEQLKLIAPATIYYTLNTNYFNAQIAPWLGQVTFTEIILDCGNGQKLPLNLTTAQFEWSCVYFKKGEYLLNLETKYVNIPTSERFQANFSWGSIVFDAEIEVQPTKWTLSFNDALTEMIVGETPSKVWFDASSVFSDLGLTGYTILRDFDGDGEQDKQNDVTTTFVYNKAQLYNVYMRFPWLNDYIYTFPVRVEQSDTPVCEIIISKTEGKKYMVSTKFLDDNVRIENYKFDIIDTKTNKVIDTIRQSNGVFEYQFQGAWVYAIQNTYLTEDEKQGQCESDDIQVGVSDFNVQYVRYAKSAQSPDFQKVTDKGIAYEQSGKLILTEIPTVLQLQLQQISPNMSTTTKKVWIDGKQVISSDSKIFEYTIEDNKEHEAKIVIEDIPSGAKTEIIVPIQVNRADIIGKIIVTPDTVGIDPFTVKFDASTTIVNDPTDELVSFTWDFGDGTGSIKKDFSESIITHTYRYDTIKNNGVYHPVLTIRTKKWREISISPETNIMVKRANQTLAIIVESHPAQVAKIGDKIDLSIDFNGLPTKIMRDFGNGKTLTCDSRQSCGSTSYVYTQPGTYQVRASVIYDDQPTLEGSVVVKIKE